ncbi:MAG TPA: hypothetical protein VFU48_04245 [Nitrospira sp.]|nr:hypothetical protein [Nitrospira sp.]
MSSIIDASLAFCGAIAVVLIGISILSLEFITVSTSSDGAGRQSGRIHYPLLQVAA